MGRSQSFASASSDCGALLRLAFASATCLKTLNLAREEQLVGSLCKRHAVISYELTFETPTACKRMVSGTISLFCSKCFSPFPHGTGSLSVSQEYLALRDGPRGFRQDFSCPALLRILLMYSNLTRTGLSPSIARLSRRFCFVLNTYGAVLQPRKCRNIFGLGCFAFARHY